MFKKIKYFIQRGRRGYSDEDLWDFYDYLCEIIPPALRKLKEKSYGCPGDLWDKKSKNNECHKWNEILEEIAQGFEAAKSITSLSFFKHVKQPNGYYTNEIDRKKEKLLNQKYNRGMELFSKYFLNLWD